MDGIVNVFRVSPVSALAVSVFGVGGGESPVVGRERVAVDRDWTEISITRSPAAPEVPKVRTLLVLAPDASRPKGTPLIKLEDCSPSRFI